MKMHKKLFGLLATAVVGLTLTSCGGGGGGGGGESSTPSDTETNNTPQVSLAPSTIVGRTLEALWEDGDIDSFTFLDNSVVRNVYTNVSAGDEPVVFTGTYTYSASGSSAILVMQLANTDNIRVKLDFENGRLVGYESLSQGSSMWKQATLK